MPHDLDLPAPCRDRLNPSWLAAGPASNRRVVRHMLFGTLWLLGWLILAGPSGPAYAQQATTNPANPNAASAAAAVSETPETEPPQVLVTEDEAKKRGWQRLTKNDYVWVDKKNKHVIVAGVVCHRAGPLEMFACPLRTKEYESVVAVYSKAFVVHAALLAVGAQPGKPVQFVPEYVPASGTVIAIDVQWKDAAGKLQTTPAQQWVREFKTKKPMPYDWVFAGSGFWQDEETGQRHYRAEGGDFICVSNFSSATLDVPVSSTQSNEGLMFDAFTDNIPPEGTPVLLVLKPQFEPPRPSDKPASDKPAPTAEPGSQPQQGPDDSTQDKQTPATPPRRTDA